MRTRFFFGGNFSLDFLQLSITVLMRVLILVCFKFLVKGVAVFLGLPRPRITSYLAFMYASISLSRSSADGGGPDSFLPPRPPRPAPRPPRLLLPPRPAPPRPGLPTRPPPPDLKFRVKISLICHF